MYPKPHSPQHFWNGGQINAME